MISSGHDRRVKKIIFTIPAQADIRRIDRETAMRILTALHRFAETGEGDVKKLQEETPGRVRRTAPARRRLPRALHRRASRHSPHPRRPPSPRGLPLTRVRWCCCCGALSKIPRPRFSMKAQQNQRVYAMHATGFTFTNGNGNGSEKNLSRCHRTSLRT
jgi:hypothetical protein